MTNNESPKERLRKFKQELKELLIKYDAHINANVGAGSDTHGIYDESIEIGVRNDPKMFNYTAESISGWALDRHNIDEVGQ